MLAFFYIFVYNQIKIKLYEAITFTHCYTIINVYNN